MSRVKKCKVEFVDTETMERVDELWNIVVELNEESSVLNAWLIGETPELDKLLEIRMVNNE